MENITQLYKAVYQELLGIQKQAKSLAAQRQQSGAKLQEAQNNVRAQYTQKRQQLQEDLQTAEGFLTQTIALVGGSVPVVPPQQPDFVRMQQLFVSIDGPYDPEVRQLLTMAAGAVNFLKNQLNQLSAQEAAAIRSASAGIAGSSAQQDDSLIGSKYNALLSSSLMQRLATAVKDQSNAYFINKQETYDLPVPASTSELLKFGVVQRPFPVPAAFEPKLQAMFGIYYDPKTKTLRLPFGFRTDRAVKIMLRSPESMKPRLQRALWGMLFNILRHYTPLSGRVVYIDPATYNPEHLGLMKHFAGKDRMITFPTGDAAAVAALSQMVAAGSTTGNKEIRYLIVRGYPGSLSTNVRDRIRNICNNSAQYRISVILICPVDNQHLSDTQDIAAMSDALQMSADDQFFYLEQNGEKPVFAFFTAPNAMTPAMCSRFNTAYEPKILGSKYTNRVPLLPLPYHPKGVRKMNVPYGVDAADKLCGLDFSNTNFAMYLMGAAGSGKSTLLHTIITGLLRQYHPDDVELWLADFKMGEFSQYINPMPPHIKYILLDESAELVYDFVELLTKELLQRKQYFSLHPELKKLDAVSAAVHMPTVFVIIDEFSLMSQVIHESEYHQRLLTNLLTEGRALGFKFIFASQEYTKGIQGLSGAARDQVQTRIAMKNTTDEIKQTLELPGSTMTDQFRRWIDTLPPHVALYKYYDEGKKQTVLSRAQVLYFPDGYGPQRQMIEALNKQLRKVSTYDPSNNLVYADKHPVVADGTSYRAFSPKGLAQSINHFRKHHPEDVFDEDVFFSPGDPRRLIAGQLVQLTDENRENLLLLTGSELACAMSVIQSAAKAFLLQKGNVQVWAYRRNRLYKLYGGSQFSKYQCYHTPEDIGDAIEELKEKIKTKQQDNRLIVLLGMERVLEDLENMELSQPSIGSLQDLAVSTAEEQAAYDQYLALKAAMDEELDRIEDEGEAAGKSDEEIEREMNEAIARYTNKNPVKPTPAAPVAAKPAPRVKPDYAEDLRYIVGHGSNYGYHFLLCAEDYPKLRASKLKIELFRHKLSFCISSDDASTIFGRRRAAQLPARIGLYSTDIGEYTFRPYLHRGITWDNWYVDETGNVIRGTI